MMPPPITTRRFGTSRRLTASFAPMICLPSNLKGGSSMVLAPVASTMAFSALTISLVPSASVTSTVFPEQLGAARHVVGAVALEQAAHAAGELLDDALFPVLQGAGVDLDVLPRMPMVAAPPPCSFS
jgi:hypothetical protein